MLLIKLDGGQFKKWRKYWYIPFCKIAYRRTVLRKLLFNCIFFEILDPKGQKYSHRFKQQFEQTTWMLFSWNITFLKWKSLDIFRGSSSFSPARFSSDISESPESKRKIVQFSSTFSKNVLATKLLSWIHMNVLSKRYWRQTTQSQNQFIKGFK